MLKALKVDEFNVLLYLGSQLRRTKPTESQGHIFLSDMENNKQDNDSLEDKQLPSMKKLPFLCPLCLPTFFFVVVIVLSMRWLVFAISQSPKED